MPIPYPLKQPCVYILASKRDGVLYIGVTSNLANRVSLHKQDLIEGFTKRYGVHLLVFYEMHHTMPEWRDLWTETGEILMMGPGGQEIPSEHTERM